MNKAKKVAKEKYIKAREGLSSEQVAELNRVEQEQEKIEKLAKSIHIEKFPEEYDFMYDSCLETSERKKGINPMNQEYIEKIKLKRTNLGVSQLDDSGMSVSMDSFDLCLSEAKTLYLN